MELLKMLLLANLIATAPSIGTAQITSNQTAGIDNQVIVTTTPVANVAEVKATTTVTVNALPGNNETITIGSSCVVTFTTVAGSTTDEVNCNDNNASIDRDTGAGNAARTASDIASVIRTLTNISDNSHGALTVSGSGANVIFTTAGTETSDTEIDFVDNTSGDISLSVATVGVVPVAQVNHVDFEGTFMEEGDKYTITFSPQGSLVFTVTQGMTVLGMVNTFRSTIDGNPSLNADASVSGSSKLILTSITAGTAFTQTSSSTNRPARAQVVSFTPANVATDHKYTIYIDGGGADVDIRGAATTKNVVEALQSVANNSTIVDCTENDTSITCTAENPGTAFNFSASVTPIGDSTRSSTSSSSASPDSSAPSQATPPIDLLPSTLPGRPSIAPSGPASPSSLSRSLSRGKTGEDIKVLQRLLNRDLDTRVAGAGAGAPGNETSIFGPLTLAAVQKFQLKYSIANPGIVGYGVVGPKTRAKLQEIYGE